MAKEVFPLKAIWMQNALPMLPLAGKHIGSGEGWEGWSLALDYVKREVIISPPKKHKLGKLRVPLEWGVVYQLGMGGVKDTD